MNVLRGIGEAKPEPRGVRLQPPKRGGPGKRGVEFGGNRRANINRPPGVVLAATGSGDQLEDFGEGFAGREFCPDYLDLTGNAAKPRQRQQSDAVPRGGGAHPFPGRRGARGQSHGLTIIGRQRDCHEATGLGLPG